MDLSPILTVSRPFLGDIYHGQIQHFQETVIGWKYRLGFGDFPELAVKSFNRVRGIDQTSDSFRILKIRWKICPVIFPWLCNLRVFPAPFFVKAVQFCQCNFFCRSCIYTLQICHKWFDFFVRNKFRGVPDLMDYALLDLGLGKYCFTIPIAM